MNKLSELVAKWPHCIFCKRHGEKLEFDFNSADNRTSTCFPCALEAALSAPVEGELAAKLADVLREHDGGNWPCKCGVDFIDDRGYYGHVVEDALMPLLRPYLRGAAQGKEGK